MSSEPRFNRLRIYNIFMGFLHLAQAIFIIILSNNFTLPITTSFLTYDESIGQLWPVTNTLVNLPNVLRNGSVRDVGLDNEVVSHLKGPRPAGQAGRGNKRKEKGVMRTKKISL